MLTNVALPFQALKYIGPLYFHFSPIKRILCGCHRFQKAPSYPSLVTYILNCRDSLLNTSLVSNRCTHTHHAVVQQNLSVVDMLYRGHLSVEDTIDGNHGYIVIKTLFSRQKQWISIYSGHLLKNQQQFCIGIYLIGQKFVRQICRNFGLVSKILSAEKLKYAR